MHIVRFRAPDSPRSRVGVHEAGRVTALTTVTSLAELWALPAAEIRSTLDAAAGESFSLPEIQVLAPVDGRTEVWAAGVTYETSREARVEESERAATVYELVYDAARPELFFKSVAWRVVGPDGRIAARADSITDVPEPELAVVANSAGVIVGYTICNDVSSRTIEGENPLYLPQAKVYQGACSLGPWIRPAWEVSDPYRLAISMRIDRGGAECWSGRASTAQLHRRLDDLVSYLMRAEAHPDGVLLSTGTCLVPGPPFTLTHGDVVTIAIDDVGTLSNPVVRGRTDQTDQTDPPR